MKRVVSFLFTFLLVFSFTVPVFATDVAPQSENKVLTSLFDQMEKLQREKNKPKGNYSKVQEINLDFKIMLQYMKDGSISGAENYYEAAKKLIRSEPELERKAKGDLERLDGSFNSWKVEKSITVYQSIQKSVSNLLTTLKLNEDEVAGEDTFKIILMIVGCAAIILLILKILTVKKVK